MKTPVMTQILVATFGLTFLSTELTLAQPNQQIPISIPKSREAQVVNSIKLQPSDQKPTRPTKQKQDLKQQLLESSKGASPIDLQKNLLTGNSNGGGGGGIKMPDGKVYTVAQAGLKFPDSNAEPFYPDFEDLEMAKETLKSLEAYCSPNFDSGCRETMQAISAEITSNDHIYQPAKIVNQNLFDRMKTEYQSYVSKLPIKGQFVLPAYTDEKTTYFFPDYFDAGTDRRTRSLYLIHEAVFSSHPKKLGRLALEKVLRLDVAILAVQADVNPTTVRAFRDAVTVISASREDIFGHLEIELTGNYLEYLADVGISVSLDQLFPEKLSKQFLGSMYAEACYAASRESDYKKLEDFYRVFRFGLPSLSGLVEVDAFQLSKNRRVETDFFKVFFGKALTFKCPRTYEEVAKLETNLNVLISDLEFRGVRVFSKTTQKPIIGFNYYEDMGFHPIKKP